MQSLSIFSRVLKSDNLEGRFKRQILKKNFILLNCHRLNPEVFMIIIELLTKICIEDIS